MGKISLPRKTVFYLGLHLAVAALVFGVISYYYSQAAITEIERAFTLGEDEEHLILVTPENVTAEPFTYRMRSAALETIYPLRGWHFFAYVFLAAGVVMMLGSRYMRSLKFSVKITKG